MSVDKFGRRSDSSKLKLIRGPPGEGFSLTKDGDYDIQNKRLCNVNGPKLPLDVVNKAYLDDRLTIKAENTLSFNGFRLSETGSPVDKNDAVNLGYLKENTLTLDKEGFDAENRNIRRVKFPEHESDAVNKTYVDKKLPILENEGCDFQQFRLINIGNPVKSGDAVNNETLLKTMKRYKQDLEKYFEQKIPFSSTEFGIDFKNRTLSNIDKPRNAGDAVNKETLINVMRNYTRDLENYCDRKVHYEKNENDLDFKNMKLSNVGRPTHENDVVTVRYLLDMLTLLDDKLLRLLYNTYKDMTKDTPVKGFDEWTMKITM